MKVGALLPSGCLSSAKLILGDPRPCCCFIFSSWFPQMATELRTHLPGVRGTVSGAEMATCGTREEKQPEQTSPEKSAAWWEGKAELGEGTGCCYGELTRARWGKAFG